MSEAVQLLFRKGRVEYLKQGDNEADKVYRFTCDHMKGHKKIIKLSLTCLSISVTCLFVFTTMHTPIHSST